MDPIKLSSDNKQCSEEKKAKQNVILGSMKTF